MRKFLAVISIVTMVICDMHICYANNTKIEVTSTDAEIENGIAENENIQIEDESLDEYVPEDDEPMYEKELEDYVDNIIQNTDPDLRIMDPDMSILKHQLYELKQVYSDYSYQQLAELLNTTETEEEYYRLLGQEESYETNLNFPMLYSSAVLPTSTGSVLSSEVWNSTLNYNCVMTKNNTKYNYLFKNILLNKDYIIPGLAVTNLNGEECERMVPQGICIAGEYLLISAYCYDESHNSVIYVVKLSTMKFVCTIKLNIISHVGGIAYDPRSKNLWVCNSKNSRLYVYSLSDLPSKAASASSNANKSFYLYNIATASVGVTPSFCTYYDGMIWVGSFSDTGAGDVLGYTASGVNLTQGARFKCPQYSQGITFFKYNGKIYCAISTSYGRRNDSVIGTYEIINFDKEKKQKIMMVVSAKKTITMPSMLEGMQTSGYNVYAIFESASDEYYDSPLFNISKSKNPCDRICKFTAQFIYK